jgi:hypothetical protein
MSAKTYSMIFILMGVLSILISLSFWFMAKAKTPEIGSRMERNALFVGLWAPSFFALGSYFLMVARL